MTGATKEVDLESVGVEDFHRAIRDISTKIKDTHSIPELSEMSERLYQMTQRVIASSKSTLPFDQSELLNEESLCLQEKIGQLEEQYLQEIDNLLSDVIITDGDIDLFSHRLHTFSPVEIAEKLLEFSKKLEGYKRAKSATSYIQKKIIDSSKKLDHLSFRYMFPIFEELNDDALQNNFVFQMRSLAKMFATKDLRAEMLYLTLSPLQRKGIELFGSDRKKAILAYVDSLQKLADLAEMFTFGREDEARRKLKALPSEIRMALQQYVWRIQPMEDLDEMDTEVISHILMKYLSDLILD